MQVLNAPVEKLYRARDIPEEVDPKKETPCKLSFELGDLDPNKGYIITPIEGLFRRVVGRLRIPIRTIQLDLPRTGSFMYGSKPLKFWAGNGNWFDRQRSKPFAEYDRHLFRGLVVFDSLDNGESSLEDILRCVREEPEGEILKIGLEKIDLSLQMGYDYATAHMNSLMARDPRNGFIYELEVKVAVPELAGIATPNINKDLAGVSSEDAVKIAEEILDRYLPQSH